MADDELPLLPDDFTVPDDAGALLDRDRDDDPLPSESGSVQVITAIGLAPGSPYICEVQPTDDVSISLPRDKAVAYAGAVLTAAIQADYQAAVVAQMRDVLCGRGRRPADAEQEATAVFMAQQLAEDVPEPDHAATAPLLFVPGLHRRTLEPGILVYVLAGDGTRTGLTAWTPGEARQHARYVLDAAIGADLDTVYRSLLVGSIDLDEQRARAVVHDLGRYRAPDDGGLAAEEAREARRPQPAQPFVVPPPKVPGPPPGARPSGGGKRRKAKRGR